MSGGFSSGDVLIPLADEYDPMFPNDYEKVMKRHREERQKQREQERQKEIEEREKYVSLTLQVKVYQKKLTVVLFKTSMPIRLAFGLDQTYKS